MIRRGLSVFLGCLVCSGALGTGTEAARARQVGLADMASRAGRIFVGRCVGKSTEVDASTRLTVTTYTFAVTDPIKGVPRGQTTVRLPGPPDRPLLAGLPVFTIGERALLILYPESAAGFSAPIGLDQGHFRILTGPDGREQAVNGIGNDRLLRDVHAGLLAAHGVPDRSGGPLDLQRLVPVLRALAAESHP